MSATTVIQANSAGAVMASASQSPGRMAVRRFCSRPAAVIGLVVVVFFIVVAVFAPWTAPYGSSSSWS